MVESNSSDIFYGVEAAAAYVQARGAANVQARQVYNWLRCGYISSTKIGRIHVIKRADVDRVLGLAGEAA